MVEPDAGLAQHAQAGLLGAVFRVFVTADIAHPARRFTQAQRLAVFTGKQRVGPVHQCGR